MLSPEYLDHCADGVIELYQRLDESIARDIARRLMKMGEITDTARWQAEQLQHAGLLFEDVVAEVAKYSGATDTAVRRAFEDAGVQSVDAEIEQYLRAGITVPPIRQSERAWNILQAALRKTNGELHNLTLTTAVETQQRFIAACTLAEMQVSSGMLDHQTAVRRAVQDASGAGASVLYPSGHIDKLDVAVRRAVLTGINQTCGKISLALAEEFGCDLMEITAHAGARPEHAVWQGKIVSLSGRRGYLSLSDIGYGTGAGFQGWNCRHSWNPFFEGISERNYTPEQIEKLNARDIEYNGQKYTAYEISQMQRKMEREIRATKRELTAFDAAGLQEDFARQSVKLKVQEQKLKDFTRATDRRVDSARVQVQGFGHSQASKAMWANKSADRYTAFRASHIAKSDSEKLPHFDKAVIPGSKLEGYALNKEHPVGKHKAVAFEKILGYTKSNQEDLVREIRTGLAQYRASARKATQYGQPFEVQMVITGANGNTAKIKTGWIIDRDSDIPRLTTVYIDE